MNRNRLGFTLMEIMVVIIVIAVLASVAGPMIGSITDQGRASATKSKLSALKSAMIAYQNDVGRFPFVGLPSEIGKSSAYNGAASALLGETSDKNIFVNEDLGVDAANNFGITNYTRRWKGPYMDADPSDFMLDSWGTKIDYLAETGGTNIYLQSAGADMNPGAIGDAMNPDAIGNGDTDDIAISVAKVRKPFI